MIHFPTSKRYPIAFGHRTRCAGIPPPLAVVVLLLLGLSIAASIGTVPSAVKFSAGDQAKPDRTTTDMLLYQSLAAQVRSGRNYYAAATATQRETGYPVRPFVTVRLPTLTWLIAALSPTGAHLLMLLLVAATVIAWVICLNRIVLPTPLWLSGGIFLIIFGVGPVTSEPAMWYSESWAGLLIALSLAIRRADCWWPSVAAALVAVFIRELALPYLMAMGLLAVLAGQRREALGWASAVGLFAVVLFGHAQAVDALTQAGDRVSPGWNGHNGWGLFVSACQQLTIMTVLPVSAIAALLPMSFFGLIAWHSPVALRTFVTLCGYSLLLAVFARSVNAYWVFLVGPILGLGLLFAPSALVDLIKSLRPRHAEQGHTSETKARAAKSPPIVTKSATR